MHKCFSSITTEVKMFFSFFTSPDKYMVAEQASAPDASQKAAQRW
jgi:hypothetical protein